MCDDAKVKYVQPRLENVPVIRFYMRTVSDDSVFVHFGVHFLQYTVLRFYTSLYIVPRGGSLT